MVHPPDWGLLEAMETGVLSQSRFWSFLWTERGLIFSNSGCRSLLGMDEEELRRLGTPAWMNQFLPGWTWLPLQEPLVHPVASPASVRGPLGLPVHGHVVRLPARWNGAPARIFCFFPPPYAATAAGPSRRYLEDMVFDALPDSGCILDETGRLIRVNAAWRHFADMNGNAVASHFEGVNYLSVCDHVTGGEATDARKVAEGLRRVLRGAETSFELPYPCDSPDRRRRFKLKARRFFRDGRWLLLLVHALEFEEAVEPASLSRESV